MEILSVSGSISGFCKQIILNFNGLNCYEILKFESGVHRVQRIPITETNGRLHTSTVTVATILERKKSKIKIKNEELKIDAFKSSGSGGQHVNTTDSAVRIKHIPTGITVIQSNKSQHQNKNKALKILRIKIQDLKEAREYKKMSKIRKKQIGKGERSERIKTYNYPQNRVTDHRSKITLYNLGDILNGGNINLFYK